MGHVVTPLGLGKRYPQPVVTNRTSLGKQKGTAAIHVGAAASFPMCTVDLTDPANDIGSETNLSKHIFFSPEPSTVFFGCVQTC